jgi:hypothetical protein
MKILYNKSMRSLYFKGCSMRLISRRDLTQFTDPMLFSYAVLHGFGCANPTQAVPKLALTYSFCFGAGILDTKYWEIEYALDDWGLPFFSVAQKEILVTLLTEEHLAIWRARQSAPPPQNTIENSPPSLDAAGA